VCGLKNSHTLNYATNLLLIKLSGVVLVRPKIMHEEQETVCAVMVATAQTFLGRVIR
jgi:hypothetical protein